MGQAHALAGERTWPRPLGATLHEVRRPPGVHDGTVTSERARTIMDKELARKRPAEVVPGRAATPYLEEIRQLPRHEILTATIHGRAELVRQVQAMARRGEIGPQYAIREVPAGWAVKVVRIRESRPRWPRYVAVGALALGLLALAVWAFVAAVSATVAAVTALAPTLLGLAGAVAVTALMVALFRPSTIEVIQRVTIKR